MGPRAGLAGGKSRPHRVTIPDRPAPSSVAIPTELHGPHIPIKMNNELQGEALTLHPGFSFSLPTSSADSR